MTYAPKKAIGQDLQDYRKETYEKRQFTQLMNDKVSATKLGSSCLKFPHCFSRINSFENPLRAPHLPRHPGCLQQAKPRLPSLGFPRANFQLFDGVLSAFKQKNALGVVNRPFFEPREGLVFCRDPVHDRGFQ